MSILYIINKSTKIREIEMGIQNVAFPSQACENIEKMVVLGEGFEPSNH